MTITVITVIILSTEVSVVTATCSLLDNWFVKFTFILDFEKSTISNQTDMSGNRDISGFCSREVAITVHTRSIYVKLTIYTVNCRIYPYPNPNLHIYTYVIEPLAVAMSSYGCLMTHYGWLAMVSMAAA